MTTHIEITGTASRLSADVRSAVDRLESLQSSFTEIKGVMDQVAFGSDWTALGTYLGVTPSEAEEVYNMWGSGTTEIHGTFLSQIQQRLG